MANAKIAVQIVGDASSLERSLKQASNATQRFSVGIGTLIKSAVVFNVVNRAIEGFTSTIRLGITEVKELQSVQAQTAAVLQSTGNSAKVTGGHIRDLALSLSNLSGIDDEVIQAGENVLLSFKDIRNGVGKNNKIFDEATRAVVDFAARTGKDIPTAATLLGRALADPAGKVAALSRAGIVFTKTQRDMIAQVQKTQGVMAAQKVLLAELEQRFGGAAKAAGSTLSGQLSILRERFKDLAGEIVGAVVPTFTKALVPVTNFVRKLSELKGGTTAKINFAIAGGEQLAKDLVSQVQNALAGIDWNAVLTSTRTELRKALGQLGAEFQKVNWKAVGHQVGVAIVASLDQISILVKSIKWQKVGSAIIDGLVAFLRGVDWRAVTVAVAKGLAAAIQAVGDLLKGAIRALAGALKDSFVQSFAGVGKAIETAVVEALLGALKKLDVTILGIHIVPGVHSLVKKLQATLTGLQAPPTVGSVKGASENVGRNAGAATPSKSQSSTSQVNTGVGTANQQQAAALEAQAKAQADAAARTKASAKALATSLQQLFASFNKQLADARKTKGTKDDLAVLNEQLATVNKLLAAHKGNLTLQREQTKIENQITSLENKRTAAVQKQKSALQAALTDQQNLFGSLFQKPDLTKAQSIFVGGSQGRRTVPGTGGTAKDLLVNITAQTNAFAGLTKDIASLVKRGAPATLVKAAQSGQISPDQVHALATASASTLQKIFAQVRRADKLIAQAAKAEINAKTATVRAGTVQLSGVHGIPGGGFAPVHESGFIVNGGLHLHGVQNVKQLQAELERQKKKQGSQRRGKLGGKR